MHTCSIYAGLGAKVKKCTACGNIKPLTEFHKESRSRDGHRSRCKVCRHNMEYRYKKKCKTEKYELTTKRYKKMKMNQEGKCLICRNSITNGRDRIDHSHKYGHVRGLLCNNCNTGLGLFVDSPRRLFNAAIYIINREILPVLKKRWSNFLRTTKYSLSLW